MTIVYRDDIGYIVAHPDNDITFWEGFAIFDADDKEVRVPIETIYLITKD